MTLLRNESKIMLYDKKMLDRYPAKDEENLRGVPMMKNGAVEFFLQVILEANI